MYATHTYERKNLNRRPTQDTETETNDSQGEKNDDKFPSAFPLRTLISAPTYPWVMLPMCCTSVDARLCGMALRTNSKISKRPVTVGIPARGTAHAVVAYDVRELRDETKKQNIEKSQQAKAAMETRAREH
jgi:hypothetical protein